MIGLAVEEGQRKEMSELRKPEKIQDLREVWAERLERVRWSQARTDTTGMTRPKRDPLKRKLLAERGQLGPFEESERPLPRRR